MAIGFSDTGVTGARRSAVSRVIGRCCGCSFKAVLRDEGRAASGPWARWDQLDSVSALPALLGRFFKPTTSPRLGFRSPSTVTRIVSIKDRSLAGTPVVSVSRQQPDADRVAPSHQAIAVMLDFVDPVRPGRRALGGRGQARLDEAAARRRGRYAQHPGKVGADTGGVESANANGGVGHCTFRLRLGYLVRKWGIHRWRSKVFSTLSQFPAAPASSRRPRRET